MLDMLLGRNLPIQGSVLHRSLKAGGRDTNWQHLEAALFIRSRQRHDCRHCDNIKFATRGHTAIANTAFDTVSGTALQALLTLLQFSRWTRAVDFMCTSGICGNCAAEQDPADMLWRPTGEQHIQ